MKRLSPLEDGRAGYDFIIRTNQNGYFHGCCYRA